MKFTTNDTTNPAITNASWPSRLQQSIPPSFTIWYNSDDSKYYGESNHAGVADIAANTDATTVIQAAIDAVPYVSPNFGGIVFLGPYLFSLTGTLNLDDGVSLIGSGCDTTRLQTAATWGPNDVMLNVGAHHRVTVKGMYIVATVNAATTTAIYAGDDTGSQAYSNSYEDLFLNGMNKGFDTGQNAVNTGEYDSTFINIRTNDVKYPLILVGSGTTLINPRINSSATGTCLTFVKATGYSIGPSVQVFGGVVGSSVYAMDITNAQEINFYGTYFESSTTGLVDIGAGDRFYRLTLHGGRISVDAAATYMMDFNAYDGTGGGVVSLENVMLEGAVQTFRGVPLTGQTNYINAKTVDTTILTYKAPNNNCNIEVGGWIQVTARAAGGCYFKLNYNGGATTVYLPTFSGGGGILVPINDVGDFSVASTALRMTGLDTITLSVDCDGTWNGTYSAVGFVKLLSYADHVTTAT